MVICRGPTGRKLWSRAGDSVDGARQSARREVDLTCWSSVRPGARSAGRRRGARRQRRAEGAARAPGGRGRRGPDGTSRAHLERAAGPTCSTPSRSTWSGSASRSACDAGPAVGSTCAVSARRSGTADDRIPPRGVRVEIDVVPGAVWQDVEVRCDVESAAAAEVIAGMVEAGGLALGAPARVGVPRRRRGRRRRAGSGSCRCTDRWWSAGSRSRRPAGLPRADLEHFRFPSGAELVELSTRCCAAGGGRDRDGVRAVARRAGGRGRAGVPHEDLGVARGDRPQPGALSPAVPVRPRSPCGRRSARRSRRCRPRSR